MQTTDVVTEMVKRRCKNKAVRNVTRKQERAEERADTMLMENKTHRDFVATTRSITDRDIDNKTEHISETFKENIQFMDKPKPSFTVKGMRGRPKKGLKGAKGNISVIVKDVDNSGSEDDQIKTCEIDGEKCINVECGTNKAVLYLSRLCAGSKGACISYQGTWLTPNEFQLVSGRESAKDWKRSIRHNGRSLKLFMANGVLTVNGCVKKGHEVTLEEHDGDQDFIESEDTKNKEYTFAPIKVMKKKRGRKAKRRLATLRLLRFKVQAKSLVPQATRETNLDGNEKAPVTEETVENAPCGADDTNEGTMETQQADKTLTNEVNLPPADSADDEDVSSSEQLNSNDDDPEFPEKIEDVPNENTRVVKTKPEPEESQHDSSFPQQRVPGLDLGSSLQPYHGTVTPPPTPPSENVQFYKPTEKLQFPSGLLNEKELKKFDKDIDNNQSDESGCNKLFEDHVGVAENIDLDQATVKDESSDKCGSAINEGSISREVEKQLAKNLSNNINSENVNKVIKYKSIELSNKTSHIPVTKTSVENSSMLKDPIKVREEVFKDLKEPAIPFKDTSSKLMDSFRCAIGANPGNDPSCRARFPVFPCDSTCPYLVCPRYQQFHHPASLYPDRRTDLPYPFLHLTHGAPGAIGGLVPQFLDPFMSPQTVLKMSNQLYYDMYHIPLQHVYPGADSSRPGRCDTEHIVPPKKRKSSTFDSECPLDLSVKKPKVQNVIDLKGDRVALDFKSRTPLSLSQPLQSGKRDLIKDFQDKTVESQLLPGRREKLQGQGCSVCLYGKNVDDIRTWSVDRVCCFLEQLEGCDQYVKTFRDYNISGRLLPHLTTQHLTTTLGMHVRPALTLWQAVHYLLRDTPNPVCVYCKR